MADTLQQTIYLKEKQVSKRLSIPVKTLQRWRSEGGGPPFAKFGRSVRYHIDDVKKYESQRRYFSTSEVAPQSELFRQED